MRGAHELGDYYDILNVVPDAGHSAIRAAYRRAISRYHPDTWDGDPAHADRISKQINEAYSVLKDNQRRAAYDRAVANSRLPSRAQPRRIGTTHSISSKSSSRTSKGRFGALWAMLGAAAAAFLFTNAHQEQPRFSDGTQQSAFSLAGLNRPGQSLDQVQQGRSTIRRATAVSEPDRVNAVRPEVASGFAGVEWPATLRIDDEDRFTIQLSCASAGGEGSAAYRACYNSFLSEVLSGSGYPLRVPMPHEIIAQIELDCAPNRMDGPAAYNGCLKRASRQLIAHR